MLSPTIDEPCCDILLKIVQHFGFFTYVDYPDLANMFYLSGDPTKGDDTKYRINFCPSCGKKIRGITLKVEDIT